MAAPMDSVVDLGFVEKTEKWKLSSHYFPSKVGDIPSWLSLKPLPLKTLLSCPKCSQQCTFLLQAYAPISRLAYSFHRTLYIFICRKPSCHVDGKRTLIALRSQLPRENDFYSSEPPKEEKCDSDSQAHQSAAQHQAVCVVCGCSGPLKCSQCHVVAYCSKGHQIAHWKAGHKHECKELKEKEKVNMDAVKRAQTILFPEYEIVMEEEILDEEEIQDITTATADDGKSLVGHMSSCELEKVARCETKEDKLFHAFKDRTRLEPEQILRYDRYGKPLWISSKDCLKDTDIPKCEKCGGNRVFEFQILPQLLIHLGVDSMASDSMDWGTLLVYTCKDSCDIGNKYQEEFIHQQNYSNENT